MRARTLWLLLLVILAPGVALADRVSARTAPYDDLLEVLAIHAWHLDDDLYRHPAPVDGAGRNVFVVTIDRLDGWQTRFPTRLVDVVTFARAQALERLGSWAAAHEAYARVAATPASPLRDRAQAAARRTERFERVDALPEDGATLQAVLDALGDKLDAWADVATDVPEPPYASLARVEIERLEVRAATLLVHHRHAIVDGPETAERALRALIERHADSRLLARHVLRLADFYASEAEGYADAFDRPLAFDGRHFELLVDRALDAYQKLASWDGIPEKPVARARFDAMASLRDATLEARK